MGVEAGRHDGDELEEPDGSGRDGQGAEVFAESAGAEAAGLLGVDDGGGPEGIAAGVASDAGVVAMERGADGLVDASGGAGHNGPTEAILSPEEISRAILAGFSGYMVDGRRIEEWVGIAEQFYRERAVAHSAAELDLLEILRYSDAAFTEADLDWREEIEKIPPELLYSCDTTFSDDAGFSIERVADHVCEVWQARCDNPNDPSFILHGVKRVNPRMATEVPRVFLQEHLKKLVPDIDEISSDPDALLKRIQKYQLLFLAASSEEIREVEKQSNGQKSPNGGKKSPSLHRIAHVFGQVAALLSMYLKNLQVRLGDEKFPAMRKLPGDTGDFKVPAYAAMFFERIGDREQVRKYIDSCLSLIFPDKGDGDSPFINRTSGGMRLMTNEDMVTMNLQILAEEYGLYDEYRDIFTAVHYYRRMQNVRGLHWEPKEITKDPKEGKGSLKDVVTKWREENKGDAPVVLSFGYGDGLLEEFMLSRTATDGKFLIEKVIGVEVDYDSEEECKIVESGRMKKYIFGVKDKIRKRPDGGYDEDSGLMDWMMDKISETADIVVAADSLHETSRPLPWTDRLYTKKVNNGGYMYVSDPVHCSAIDDVTDQAMNPFDRTKFKTSMMTLEDIYQWVQWLVSIRGAVSRVDFEKIVTSFAAGNNDHFTRMVQILYKPKGGGPAYQMPREEVSWEDTIRSEDAIFGVWPFTLVPQDKREYLLSKMRERIEMSGDPEIKNRHTLVNSGNGTFDLRFSSLKRMLIKMLVPADAVEDAGGDVVRAADNFVRKCVPFPKLQKMFEQFQVAYSYDLARENVYAGEVLALKRLILELCPDLATNLTALWPHGGRSPSKAG